MIALTLAVAASTACMRQGAEQSVTAAIPGGVEHVDLMFVHDGVKMYRFNDNGRFHYFTVPVRPGERTEAITAWGESCGKGCVTEREAAIVTVQP